jgi:hypothetical protein
LNGLVGILLSLQLNIGNTTNDNNTLWKTRCSRYNKKEWIRNKERNLLLSRIFNWSLINRIRKLNRVHNSILYCFSH